jgi:hypothetical protein
MGLGQALMYMGGGALAGAGEGMAMKAKNDMELKRQQVLEAIRSRYNQEDATHQAGLNDGLAQNAADRKLVADMLNDERDVEGRIKIEGVKHGNDLSLEEVKARNTRSLEGFKAVLDQRRDAASIKLKAEIDNGEIKDVVQDSSGRYIKILNDGRTVATKIIGPVKGDSGDGSLAELRSGGPAQRTPVTTQPTPQSAPAEKAPQKISAQAYTRLLTEIGNSADPRVAGLTPAQKKQKLIQMLAAKGLSPP